METSNYSLAELKIDLEIKKMEYEIISKSIREKELEIFKLRKEIEDISIIDEIRQIKDMLKKLLSLKLKYQCMMMK